MDYFLTGLQQGLVLALVAYALMVPFRLLDFPDLSAEGAYPLGGAVCSSLLLLHCPVYCAVIVACLCGGIVGLITSVIHLRLKVNTLLSGIIVSTMVYSLNLRLMGKPNLSLFHAASLFDPNNPLSNSLILLGILLCTVIPLALLLQTPFGLKLRTVGLNTSFARQWGISVAGYTLLGLFIGGCFSGLAGGLMVELQGYMDVGMGIGIVIHGLAALMIGEALVRKQKLLLAPLVGALVYQQIQGLALNLGLAPSDLKLFTGAIVLSVIAVQAGGKHVSTD